MGGGWRLFYLAELEVRTGRREFLGVVGRAVVVVVWGSQIAALAVALIFVLVSKCWEGDRGGFTASVQRVSWVSEHKVC
jgi:hypothetical protein